LSARRLFAALGARRRRARAALAGARAPPPPSAVTALPCRAGSDVPLPSC